METKHLLLGLLTVAIWGFNAVAMKYAVIELPPLLFFGLRLFITGLVFLPFADFRKVKAKKIFAISMYMNVLYGGLAFYSLVFLTASSYSLLLKLDVPLSVLLAAIFFKEKVGYKSILGMIISFFGIGIIFGAPEVSKLGFLLVFLGSLSWGFANIKMRSLGKVNPYAFTSLCALFAAPILILLSFIIEKPTISDLSKMNALPIYFVLFYQVVIISIATVIWQRLLAKSNTTKVVSLLFVQPVFSICGGVFLFGDVVTKELVIGGLVTILGATIILKSKNKVSRLSFSILKEAGTKNK